MEKSTWLLVCLVILCGCAHDRGPEFEKLGLGLERSWPNSHSASMTMTVSQSGGHPVLHCRLQNSTRTPLALDRSRLPWMQPIFFTGTVVTSKGRTFAVGPVMVLAYLVGSPNPYSMASNETLEGDIEINSLPQNPMVGPRAPQDEDTLLLWSYEFPIYEKGMPQGSTTYDQPPMQSVRLTGITFMPKQAMKLLVN